jgi:hypothetical protein
VFDHDDWKDPGYLEGFSQPERNNVVYHIYILTYYEYRYILASMIERIVQDERRGGLPHGIERDRPGEAIAAPMRMEMSKGGESQKRHFCKTNPK